MKSELAKKHTKFDELIKELESDPQHAEGMEKARIEVSAYFVELKRRRGIVEDALFSRLIDEFRDNLEIHSPGPLAHETARALVGVVMRLLGDNTLTGPMVENSDLKIEF